MIVSRIVPALLPLPLLAAATDTGVLGFSVRKKCKGDLKKLYTKGSTCGYAPGDSVVVRPGGEIVAGPLHEEHGILYADIEPGRVAAEHRTLDVVGHYARDDVFTLTVDRSARTPVVPRA